MIAYFTGGATVFASVCMGACCTLAPHPLVVALMSAGIGVLAWVTVLDVLDAVHDAQRVAAEHARALVWNDIAARQEHARQLEALRVRELSLAAERERGRRFFN